jgi:hypothetical protein
MDYTARTGSPIFSLAPRRRSGERAGVRGCLLSPILRTPQYPFSQGSDDTRLSGRQGIGGNRGG